MGYKPLPIKEVDLDDLRLDLDNYRIPTHRSDEAAALKYLYVSEDVLGQARMIIRDGYYDNEVPIAIANKDGSYVVLEGNRRVAALKVLQDPTAIPGHEHEVEALLKRYAKEADDLPTRIRVMVDESRAKAAPAIARLHTGESKRAWNLDQQATFYYSLLDSSTSVAEVRADYPDVNVPRLIKMAVMRRFVENVRFTDKSLREWAKSDELKMSAFEYAYKLRPLADAVGVAFTPEGLLEPASKTPNSIGRALTGSHLAALERLVSEFRSGRLNTRSLALKRGTPEFDDLLVELNGGSAGRSDGDGGGATGSRGGYSSGSSGGPGGGSSVGSGGGSGSAGEGASGSGSGGPGASGSSGRGPNHPDTKKSLDLNGLDYANTNVNLNSRYQELRRVSVVDLPIATAILMRSVLEATIKWHYEGTGTRAHGLLKEVFPRVRKDYGSDRALKAAIGKVADGTITQPGSITWFNHVTHDGDSSPTTRDVQAAWKVINPLLRHLLRQAPAPSAKP